MSISQQVEGFDENETHIVFFDQMFEGDITSDDEVITYHYYQ